MSRGQVTNLLVTGLPGVGKTTVLRQVARQLPVQPSGFVTDEVRVAGRRTGFRLETFDGVTAILADVNLSSSHRVGRYGVDVAALEQVVGQALSVSDAGQPVMIDEIGKMECCSHVFIQAMRRLLDHSCPLVATVAQYGRGFIAEVKRRPDVTVLTVTRENRQVMPERVIVWLSNLLCRP